MHLLASWQLGSRMAGYMKPGGESGRGGPEGDTLNVAVIGAGFLGARIISEMLLLGCNVVGVAQQNWEMIAWGGSLEGEGRQVVASDAAFGLLEKSHDIGIH